MNRGSRLRRRGAGVVDAENAGWCKAVRLRSRGAGVVYAENAGCCKAVRLRSPDAGFSGVRDAGFLGGVSGLRSPDTGLVVFGMRVIVAVYRDCVVRIRGFRVFGMRVSQAACRDCAVRARGIVATLLFLVQKVARLRSAGTGYCGVRDAGFGGGVSELRSPDTGL